METQPLRALFVDFDAYFASVEQHLLPHLRGRAVGVAPVLAETSCCIAASYEAKAVGVTTGTRVSDARVLCPGIEIVEARPAEYVALHHQLVAAVESCIHVEEVLSIDEMWCWLPYNWRSPEHTEKIGRKIKAAVHRQVSPWINASVGVAPNRWLAKMASKMKKPNGLLVIESQDLPEILHSVELRDLHGVGKAMELRLHAHGIHNTETLCGLTRQQLHTAWGSVQGDRLWFHLRGDDIAEPKTSEPKSLGHSHVLAPDKRRPEQALAVVHKLLQKAGQRLRHGGQLTQNLQLNIHYLQGGCWTAGLNLEATSDSLVLVRAVAQLWQQRPQPSELLIKVSVLLDRLTVEQNHTPSLFTEEQDTRIQSRGTDLNKTMDELVKKFGRHSVYWGGAHPAMESAPMRISFGHIPDVEIEGD